MGGLSIFFNKRQNKHRIHAITKVEHSATYMAQVQIIDYLKRRRDAFEEGCFPIDNAHLLFLKHQSVALTPNQVIFPR